MLSRPRTIFPASRGSALRWAEISCFPNATTVVKLGPPCWPGEMAREVAALRFVAGRLPVATPTLVANGTLDGWDYLVQQKLPGSNLWQLWPQLDSARGPGSPTNMGS